MDCLIELYDHDQINNLAVVLSLRPKKVVFLYNQARHSRKKLDDLACACHRILPNLEFDAQPLTGASLEEIRDCCKLAIRRNPNCYVDVTGGGELAAIGAYLACVGSFTPIFRVDVERGLLYSAYGCKSMEGPLPACGLTMDALLLAHGAAVGGYGHPTPDEASYSGLLSYCRAIFQDVPAWKELCSYLQAGCTAYPIEKKPLLFCAPLAMRGPGKPYVRLDKGSPQRKLLRLAARLGLLRNLQLGGQEISFSFASTQVKRYLTDFGTFLELFTYITLQQSGEYQDVRMSVKVDWNGMRHSMVEVTNEIDVTCFYGAHPIFISCKLSEPSSDALQELSVYASYFGGRRSRCVLVTLGNINKERSYTYWRAKEMGITIIDGHSIRAGRFLSDMREALRPNEEE
ncbi:MAG TPA: DUF1887 family protein [Candidatus Gallacutalibacter stercoravium]|nr:DUF1887 family protein [Candidatus Gallacutalibacter stercoravium]